MICALSDLTSEVQKLKQSDEKKKVSSLQYYTTIGASITVILTFIYIMSSGHLDKSLDLFKAESDKVTVLLKYQVEQIGSVLTKLSDNQQDLKDNDSRQDNILNLLLSEFDKMKNKEKN